MSTPKIVTPELVNFEKVDNKPDALIEKPKAPPAENIETLIQEPKFISENIILPYAIRCVTYEEPEPFWRTNESKSPHQNLLKIFRQSLRFDHMMGLVIEPLDMDDAYSQYLQIIQNHNQSQSAEKDFMKYLAGTEVHHLKSSIYQTSIALIGYQKFSDLSLFLSDTANSYKIDADISVIQDYRRSNFACSEYIINLPEPEAIGITGALAQDYELLRNEITSHVAEKRKNLNHIFLKRLQKYHPEVMI